MVQFSAKGSLIPLIYSLVWVLASSCQSIHSYYKSSHQHLAHQTELGDLVSSVNQISIPTTWSKQSQVQKLQISLCKKRIHQFNNIWSTQFKQASIKATQPKYIQKIINLNSNKASACYQNKFRNNFSNAWTKWLQNRKNKVGLILPAQKRYQKYNSEVLKGMTKSFTKKNQGGHPPQLIIRYASTPKELKQKISELIWKENISLLVGGLREADYATLKPFGPALELPLLLLHPAKKPSKSDGYNFHVYPNNQQMAVTLVQAAKHRQWHKLTILRAQSNQQHSFIEQIYQAIDKEPGMKVVSDISYVSSDFQSMQAAAANIASINLKNREKEYQQLVLKEREQAAQENRPFRPEQVILPAKPNCDAILLPEDFRTLHYFVKLLKFHGIQKLPFMGNQNWRNRELIAPWEPFLQGSIFVDYIGLYSSLDKRILPLATASHFFLPPEQASSLDFQMIGLRAGDIAYQAMSLPQVSSSQLLKILKNLTQPNSNQRFFHPNQTSLWKNYLFELDQGTIKLNQRRLSPES